MSRSARKSKRPDPTVAPIEKGIATDTYFLRSRFSPSVRQERLRKRAAAARAINRDGILGVSAKDVICAK